MWWAIQSYIKLAVLVTVVCFAAAWLPDYLNSVTVIAGYDDVRGLTTDAEYKTYRMVRTPAAIGDILAFKIGDLPDQIAFARVRALPGDTVEFKDSRLYVRGSLVEAYDPKKAPPLPAADLGPMVVPDGHYFVLSDGHQHDSFKHGMIGPDIQLGQLKL